MALSAADKRFYSVLAAIAVLLVGWAIWLQIMPHPLGDKLEYVGKEDYGSWLPLSSTRPASLYRYETSLNEEELAQYFNRHTRAERSEWNFGKQTIVYKNIATNQSFVIFFYNKNDAKRALGINTEMNIVVIPDRHYEAAKNSLR